MNRSFASHSTGLSGGDNPLIRHRHKVDPYVSPFILNAKKKAEERAKLARMKMRKNQSPVRNEWDITPATTGLFDPTIRKQEIFRLGPRNQQSDDEANHHPSHNENHPQRIGSSTTASTNGQRQKSSRSSTSSSAPPHQPPKRTQGVTFAPNKPVGQTRSHHYMAPKSGNKTMHETSHSHNPVKPISNNGKLTIKTTATNPQRAPRPASGQRVTQSNSLPTAITDTNQTNDQLHQPEPTFANDIHDSDHQEDLLYPQTQKGPKVDRFHTITANESTSNMILTNEPQMKDIDDGQIMMANTGVSAQEPTMSTIPPPRINDALKIQPLVPSTINQPPFQNPQDIENAEPLDRAQDMHGYYKQLIRDRLKALWQKHRGESTSEEEATEPKVMRTKGRFMGVPFHGAPHGHDSQIYMRDMMASMAQIMAAVGEIVTSNTNAQNKTNRKRRSRASNRNAPEHLTPSVNQKSEFVPCTESDTFVMEMAHAMNPFAKQNLPKRKSEVLDLVMQKLQSIERCENDIRDFLTRPSQPPMFKCDDLPIAASEQQQQRHPQAQHPLPDCSNRSKPRATLRIPETHLEFSVVDTFPKLLHFENHPENEDIRQYMKEMDRIRQLKEVGFARKNSSSRITGDNVANEIYNRVLRTLGNEFEELFEDYSENFVSKV